ncbi:MAG: zinc ribbon domain-containing protein [Methanoregula sp.]|nr:zinc ribbon domain-containing protein [Methanoregula sp.]
MPKFCHGCGKEISDPVKFCPECGTNTNTPNYDPNHSLKNNEQPQSTQTDDKTIKKSNNFDQSDSDLSKATSVITHKPIVLAIIGICIFLIVISLVIVPTKTITNDVEVVFTDTETYYEKEPYIVQESYQEQVPYQTTESYTDSVPVPVSVPYQDYEYSYQTSDAGTGKYYSSVPSGCVCSSNRYLYDKDGVYGALCVQLTCQISTPVTKYRTEMQQQSLQKERPVTKYRTETKTRDVTKYHDVAKTRDVMKTRIEQRPLEVNWLLGFKTPYSLHLPIISGK